MPRFVTRTLVVLVAAMMLLTSAKPANADVAYASDSKATLVIVAAIAVVAVIGVGVYFAVHHGHSLKGCVSTTPNGLQLMNEGDQQTYDLAGDVQGLKPGDRVHINGSKLKKANAPKTFTVSKIAKDYGACKAHA